jgi:hypothetical protein
MAKRNEQFARVQQEGADTFARKNRDYADSFAKHGVLGVIIRISDKIDRYVNIERTKLSLVKDEAVRDTLMDLANYAHMAVLLLDEENEE